MERNNTTINISKELRDKINSLKVKQKLKTHNEVVEILLKELK